MIEILKRPKETAYKTICGCGCTFKFNHSDITKGYVMEADSNVCKETLFIQCPLCKEALNLSEWYSEEIKY